MHGDRNYLIQVEQNIKIIMQQHFGPYDHCRSLSTEIFSFLAQTSNSAGLSDYIWLCNSITAGAIQHNLRAGKTIEV